MFLAAAAGVALLSGAAVHAETTLKLTEVITSPQRTEFLNGQIAKFEQANPGVKVEVTSLPWGQAFEKLATMVAGREHPRTWWRCRTVGWRSMPRATSSRA